MASKKQKLTKNRQFFWFLKILGQNRPKSDILTIFSHLQCLPSTYLSSPPFKRLAPDLDQIFLEDFSDFFALTLVAPTPSWQLDCEIF